MKLNFNGFLRVKTFEKNYIFQNWEKIKIFVLKMTNFYDFPSSRRNYWFFHFHRKLLSSLSLFLFLSPSPPIIQTCSGSQLELKITVEFSFFPNEGKKIFLMLQNEKLRTRELGRKKFSFCCFKSHWHKSIEAQSCIHYSPTSAGIKIEREFWGCGKSRKNKIFLRSKKINFNLLKVQQNFVYFSFKQK